MKNLGKFGKSEKSKKWEKSIIRKYGKSKNSKNRNFRKIGRFGTSEKSEKKENRKITKKFLPFASSYSTKNWTINFEIYIVTWSLVAESDIPQLAKSWAWFPVFGRETSTPRFENSLQSLNSFPELAFQHLNYIFGRLNSEKSQNFHSEAYNVIFERKSQKCYEARSEGSFKIVQT